MSNRLTSSPTSSAAPVLTYTIGARTDKGLQRSANEDAVAILEIPGADAAFVVADGMGGLRAGDVASNEAVRVIGEILSNRMAAPQAWDDPLVPLAEAFTLANDAVNSLAKPTVEADDDTQQESVAAAPSNALMGTTCVVGLVRDGALYLAHVGDSRAYLYRGGALSRLTHDHSFVADRVRAGGDMTESEARSSRFRNMITRAIGIEPTVNPDFHQETLQPGDAVITCSDGLTTMMDDDEIETLLASRSVARLSPERAASALVDAANKKGGSDNITIVLLRAHEPGQETALAAPTSPASTASRNSGNPAAAVERDTEISERPRRKVTRERQGASPLTILLAILGAFAVVGAGALAASPEIRARLADLLTPKAAQNGSGPVDFANLGYAAPEKFGPDTLARGDLLTYSPGAGLYFVAMVSGKVAYLSRSGEAIRSVETLIPAPPPPTPLSDTHLFIATDPGGNLYFSYSKRKVIEKKTPDGKLLLRLTGLDQPEAITVDEAGNLYVVDFNQIKILRAKPNALEIQKRAALPASPAAPKKPGTQGP